MRRLKKIGSVFTLEGAAQLGHKDSLCERCGIEECRTRRAVNLIGNKEKYALVQVRSCKSFIHIIKFQQLVGFESPANTFRLGAGWADRLGPGSTVLLQGTMGKKYATVKNVHVGPFHEMESHAGENHLYRHMLENGEQPDFFEVVQGIYGPHIFNRSSIVSVIDLETA